MTEPTGMRLHMGIAEQGKLFALAGDHRRALHYYRRAMQMSVEAGDPEVFFRHYLECVVESLERMEAHAEVLEYCARAVQHYIERPPPNPMAILDLAHVYQRQGVNLLKMGERDAARAAFEHATKVADGIGETTKKTLPLARALLGWIRSGYHIDKTRVAAEQERLQYYSVRRDTVDASRAVKLPDERAPGL